MVFFDKGVAPWDNNSNQPLLPVIIAGAGPSGLVAALTLQKYGVPFVIYERNASDKICCNSGRGIDLSPSAIKILEQELGLSNSLDAVMKPYEYIEIRNMDGKHINTLRFKELSERKRQLTGQRNFSFASRSKLQHVLLEALCLTDGNGRIKDHRNGTLRCGISVTGYTKMMGKFIQVQLDNGMKVKGSALLAGDGVHSSVRQCMHERVPDSLQFTNQVGWWGTSLVKPGSALEQELQHIAADRNIQGYNVGLIVLGTSENPGCFYANEISRNVYNWAYFTENNRSDPNADLIRRGGRVPSEAEKKSELVDMIPSTNNMLRLFLESTPAANITRSALFERNGNLPTVDGRVALLGDAAQNYHPIRGEGASKALADGYVAAMRLATAIMGKSNGNNSKKSPSIEHALAGFDSRRRRKGSNTLAQKSCKYGQRATSDSGLSCWLQTTSFKFMTPSKTIRKVRKGDKSNRRFVSDMIKELKPYPKPVKSIGPPSLQCSRSHDVSVDLTPSKSFREEDVGCLCIDF